MVRSEISMPSLSNSPCTLGALQYGFAVVILLMRALTSELTGHRPTLFRCEILAQ